MMAGSIHFQTLLLNRNEDHGNEENHDEEGEHQQAQPTSKKTPAKKAPAKRATTKAAAEENAEGQRQAGREDECHRRGREGAGLNRSEPLNTKEMVEAMSAKEVLDQPRRQDAARHAVLGDPPRDCRRRAKRPGSGRSNAVASPSEVAQWLEPQP